jgi:DNA-binding response OmpR family regulator
MAKILIVDDDQDIVDNIRAVLEKEGYTISSGNNRNEGMKLLKSVAPDLMILDVMMEENDDGIAMAQEIRRTDTKLPILMLTNISKLTGQKFAANPDIVPVDVFMEKPLSPAKLSQTVREMLSKKGKAL